MSGATDSTPKFNTWSFDDACKSMSPLTPLNQAELIVGGPYGTENDGDADLVFVCHCSQGLLEGVAKELDDKLNGALSCILEENSEQYKNGSKAGSMTPTLRVIDSDADADAKKFKRYVLVGLGLGEADDASEAAAKCGTVGRSIGKAVASRCTDEASPQLQKATILLPKKSMESASFAKEMAISFYSSLYVDNRFRGSLEAIKKPSIPARHLESVTVYTYDNDNDNDSKTAAKDEPQSMIDEGKTIAGGVHLARDIVNAPHNVLNSLSLADLARNIASESKDGCLTCRILDKDECEKRGMGAYLGVARASETPPQFIHMTYKSPAATTTTTKKVGIVGKGLLFDTGGYNIKTAMMELMKFDCGGAAAVLGAAKTIGALQPPGVECHFVVAACENMVNDKGIVPSDVLVASNGVTIEVLNTDAEGRLTLADALVYCDKEVGCEQIIELSTLTGSCMVALGKEVCGVFTENDDLAKELDSVSEATGESSWRMPLVKSYNDQLKSKIADINNYGTRFGGSITAGLFLQNFVDTKRVPFAHIDIAGPVWDDASGATGFGSKLVTEWIRCQGQEKE